MDILRPDILRAKNRKLAVWVAVAMLFVVGVSVGVSRLRPAAPSVDKATIWTDEVKLGEMLREVRGLGMFVPEEIRWIPAQSDGVVDRILLHKEVANTCLCNAVSVNSHWRTPQ